MEYNKTVQSANVNVTQFVTMKDLLEMAAYLRNFKAKYASKKSTVRKKLK